MTQPRLALPSTPFPHLPQSASPAVDTALRMYQEQQQQQPRQEKLALSLGMTAAPPSLATLMDPSNAHLQHYYLQAANRDASRTQAANVQSQDTPTAVTSTILSSSTSGSTSDVPVVKSPGVYLSPPAVNSLDMNTIRTRKKILRRSAVSTSAVRPPPTTRKKLYGIDSTLTEAPASNTSDTANSTKNGSLDSSSSSVRNMHQLSDKSGSNSGHDPRLPRGDVSLRIPRASPRLPALPGLMGSVTNSLRHNPRGIIGNNEDVYRISGGSEFYLNGPINPRFHLGGASSPRPGITRRLPRLEAVDTIVETAMPFQDMILKRIPTTHTTTHSDDNSRVTTTNITVNTSTDSSAVMESQSPRRVLARPTLDTSGNAISGRRDKLDKVGPPIGYIPVYGGIAASRGDSSNRLSETDFSVAGQNLSSNPNTSSTPGPSVTSGGDNIATRPQFVPSSDSSSVDQPLSAFSRPSDRTGQTNRSSGSSLDVPGRSFFTLVGTGARTRDHAFMHRMRSSAVPSHTDSKQMPPLPGQSSLDLPRLTRPTSDVFVHEAAQRAFASPSREQNKRTDGKLQSKPAARVRNIELMSQTANQALQHSLHIGSLESVNSSDMGTISEDIVVKMNKAASYTRPLALSSPDQPQSTASSTTADSNSQANVDDTRTLPTMIRVASPHAGRRLLGEGEPTRKKLLISKVSEGTSASARHATSPPISPGFGNVEMHSLRSYSKAPSVTVSAVGETPQGSDYSRSRASFR